MAVRPVHDVVRQLLEHVDGVWRKLLFCIRSHLYDLFYMTISELELEHFLERWRLEVLPQLVYTPEVFDCDDFAFLFKSLIVKDTKANCGLFCGGLIYDGQGLLGAHAYNAVLLDDGVVFVEPQTAEVLSVLDGKVVAADGFEYKLLWVVG